jgi:hypothetical protein
LTVPAAVLPAPHLVPRAGATITSGALRTLLANRFPDAVLLPERTSAPLPTGFAPLDAILPNGGLPRGRLVVWQRAQGGGGTTAVLRTAAAGILARGERVAWVDGQRLLAADWPDGPLLVRPSSPELALRATEILLRSGGFALVVLTGVDPDATDMLRLSRMAHEGGGGFVAATARTLTASLRLSSRYVPAEYHTSSGPFGERARIDTVAIAVEARASGWKSSATLRLPVSSFDLRLALETGLADRRGVGGGE